MHCEILVGAFRRKTQTKDQRSDRFYKLYKLASFNCHTNVSCAWRLIRIFWCLSSRLTWVRVSPLTKFCLQNVPPPFNFFLFCKKNGCSKKLQRPPFYIFLALCDLPETSKKNRNFFQFSFPHAGTVEENT